MKEYPVFALNHGLALLLNEAIVLILIEGVHESVFSLYTRGFLIAVKCKLRITFFFQNPWHFGK